MVFYEFIMVFSNTFGISLIFSTCLVLFSSWVAFKQVFQHVFQFYYFFYDTLFCAFCLFIFSTISISNRRFLLLIQQIPSLFFHLIHLSLIKLLFYFLFFTMVSLIHNLKYQTCFNNFYNVFINVICFYVNNETVCTHITQSYFYTIFWFYAIIPKIYIWGFFISIVNNFPVKNFVLW